VYGDTPVLPKSEGAELLPRSPYAAAKLSGEVYTTAYARAGLVEGIALRYFNVFGPRQDPDGPYAAIIPRLFQSVQANTPMTIFGDGGQTRDFTFVENVVDANLLAGTGSAERITGQVVNVGAGNRASLLELVGAIEEVTGHRVHVQHEPPRPGDVRHSQADLNRARSVLGYEPRVTLRDGLQQLWLWYRRHEATTPAAATD
jgi:UDP-glucose 4-epimerase